VTPSDFETALRQFLDDNSRESMKVELIVIPEMMGTADGIRAVAERIRGDFIYISSDTISQFSLIDLVNLHRSSISDMTLLFSVPTNKEFLKDDVDQEYVGITQDGRVLYKTPTLELDEGITISKSLLFQSSSPFALRNDLMDIGIYIFSYWILEYIQKNMKISSIKSDLVPYVINRQFQKKEYLYEKFPSLQFRKRSLNYLENWLIQQNKPGLERQAGLETISDHERNQKEIDESDCLRCFGLIYGLPNTGNDSTLSTAATATNSFILSRVNTIPTFLALNK
jgi:NDP-sugar pyrophosphorylase family protein